MYHCGLPILIIRDRKRSMDDSLNICHHREFPMALEDEGTTVSGLLITNVRSEVEF